MLLLTRLAAGIALAICCFWLWREPKFDSLAATAAALVVLLGLFIVPAVAARQRQKVSGGSTALQAGGDIHAGSISSKGGRDVRP